MNTNSLTHSATFSITVVREKAVGWLFEMNDWELLDFLPQLTQALKYETYHESALCRNLLERAMRNPRVMHHLFWSLALDLGTMEFGDRIEVVLNALLSACGAAQRQELRCQMNLLEGLEKVAIAVRGVAGAERAVVLQTELVELSGQLPSCFRLPLDPAAEVTGLCTEECSYFESNAVPLKLVFRNSDPRSNPLRIMFKYGDDLRQDAIVLQLIRIMDKVGGGGIFFLRQTGCDLSTLFLSLPPPSPTTPTLPDLARREPGPTHDHIPVPANESTERHDRAAGCSDAAPDPHGIRRRHRQLQRPHPFPVAAGRQPSASRL